MGMTVFGTVVGGFNLVGLRDEGNFVRAGKGEKKGNDDEKEGERYEYEYVFDRRRKFGDRLWDAVQVVVGVRGVGW